MTRMTTPQDNPNAFLGLHPSCHVVDLAREHSDIDESDFPASRLSSASFLDGAIQWRQRRSRRRKSLDQVLARIDKIQIPGRKHLQAYLRRMYRRNCKPKTISTTASGLVRFLKALKSCRKDHLELITRKDIEAYVEKEQDRGLKISTVRYRLHSIYGFLRYLHSIQIVSPELLERKIHLKLPRPLPRSIPPEDSARLISVIDEVRDRAMILTLLRSGMRIGELCNLHVNDVDLNEGTVKIYEGEKNSIGRVVYIADDAAEALRAWMRQRRQNKSYLFYGRNGPLGYSACRNRFRRLLAKAELADKGYSLHCLRHSFATDLLNAGMRIECLQQLLGHSNIEVTRIYAKLSDASRQKEYFAAMARIEKGGRRCS